MFLWLRLCRLVSRLWPFALKSCVAALAFNLPGIPQAQAGSFLTNAPMMTARFLHTATLLRNGKVLVAGGYGDVTGAGASAELYDSATGTWTATGNMKYGRSHCLATLLNDGKVLVVGTGHHGPMDPEPPAELYDPATGKWLETGALTTVNLPYTATVLTRKYTIRRLELGPQPVRWDLIFWLRQKPCCATARCCF
jgi:hypothetical protein